MTKRLARLEISGEYLREILHFPEDAEFVRTEISTDRHGSIIFVVECSEFPELNDGDLIPAIRPIYTKYRGENGEVIKIERRSWGFPGEKLA